MNILSDFIWISNTENAIWQNCTHQVSASKGMKLRCRYINYENEKVVVRELTKLFSTMKQIQKQWPPSGYMLDTTKCHSTFCQNVYVK